MTPEEQRLRNAMRYYLPGSNSSGLKELAADKVSYLSVQRSLLPDLRMGSLPFKDVTVLNLSKNRLGVHAFSSLMYAVAGSASIVELDVSWNMAAADCCAAIAVLLERNTKLKKLVISNNPLTTCIGDDLGRALKTNRTLESLDMESVGLMEGSSLFEGLSGHPALTLLNVNNNTCGPKAWVKFGQAMTAGIKLTSLQARNSDLGSEGAPAVAAAIRSQKVMADIDVSGCKLGSSEAGELLEALSTCTDVRRVVMANNKLKGDVARSLAALCNKANGLEIDLSNCELSDESAKACMASLAGGKRISAFNVSGNNLGETSGAALRTALVKAWKADKRFLKVVYAGNNIEKLFYADVLADDYDDAEGEGAWLPDELDASDSKANAEVLEAVAQMYETRDGKCALKKLRLDGVVLGKPPGLGRLPRGTPAPPPIVAALLGTSALYAQLRTVTFYNTQLKDPGATYLSERIKAGWKISDLDLGMNDISDSGCTDLASAATTAGNELTRLQLRLNRIRDGGAKAMAEALGDENCKIKILILSSNVIGTAGLKTLMMAVGSAKSLEVLDCDFQKEAVWKEEDFAAGAKHLAAAISRRPVDMPSLNINLGNIEGMGMASSAIDCGAVVSEYANKHKFSMLGLQDVLDIYVCMCGPVAIKDFESMMGGFGTLPGNSPSWLVSAAMRARAVNVAHLQLSITKDRLTDWFESEADANVQEVFMCVDKALKTPNGFAWILFKEEASVAKSLQLYHEGHAAIYGSPFIISVVDADIQGAGDAGSIEVELAERAAAEAARKAQERTDVDEMYAKNLDKQKTQKAAYGGSDMGMSHANTLGGQNCVKTLDDGKPW